mgnify:CR=1 FL=1
MGHGGKNHMLTAFMVVLLVMVSSSLTSASEELQGMEPMPSDARAATGKAAGTEADTRMNRIDFGNTYIIGQSIKSGAVYLLQRKKSEINSMLKYRENYRDEILEGFSIDSQKARMNEPGLNKTEKSGSQDGKRLVSQGRE